MRFFDVVGCVVTTLKGAPGYIDVLFNDFSYADVAVDGDGVLWSVDATFPEVPLRWLEVGLGNLDDMGPFSFCL